MNLESNRLNTFTNWPITQTVDPSLIAKAGFYYTGLGSEVQCFSCGGKISDWNHGEQIMARHRRLDPNCPFVVNPQISGNIPVVTNVCPEGMESNSGGILHSLQPQSDYGVTEEDELYRSDALRLLSFVNWTDTSISREGLVSAGFYHAGEGRIRCAWCGGYLERLRRLGSLGTPLEIHRRFFPGCAHAAMLAAREAALTLSPQSPSYTPPVLTPPTIASSPDNGTSRSSNGHGSPPHQSEGAAHNARVLAEGGTWRSLGVVGGCGGSKHPTKASLTARLQSFTTWPRDRTQTPEALADAGFFYTGSEDQVRCFYCGGGLGRWEEGDEPWHEHARWFPHCGYLLLVKGKPAQPGTGTARVTGADRNSRTQRLNPESSNRVNFPFTETEVQEAMESGLAAAALGAGLDAARVRRAICRRLRNTGLPFTSAESLIDAVLDEQLNEEAWSVSPQSQRLARDILAETLREFAPLRIIPQWDDRPNSSQSERSVRSPSPPPLEPRPQETTPNKTEPNVDKNKVEISEEVAVKSPEKKAMSLEEENRQLKEARVCKVCMDNEVGVVFLPCGHLVSCAVCGAGLHACPLCRARVHALVRAYLA